VKKFLFQKKQFLLYCLIGGSGTAVTCLLYALLVQNGGQTVQVANAIGYSAGTLLSFVLNAWFNFRVSDRIAQRLAAFFGVAFLGWLASAGLLYILVGQWHWNALYAYVVVILAVVLLQYNLNRMFSFRKTV
jgi:putative flippase GtrA